MRALDRLVRAGSLAGHATGGVDHVRGDAHGAVDRGVVAEAGVRGVTRSGEILGPHELDVIPLALGVLDDHLQHELVPGTVLLQCDTALAILIARTLAGEQIRHGLDVIAACQVVAGALGLGEQPLRTQVRVLAQALPVLADHSVGAAQQWRLPGLVGGKLCCHVVATLDLDVDSVLLADRAFAGSLSACAVEQGKVATPADDVHQLGLAVHERLSMSGQSRLGR